MFLHQVERKLCHVAHAHMTGTTWVNTSHVNKNKQVRHVIDLAGPDLMSWNVPSSKLTRYSHLSVFLKICPHMTFHFAPFAASLPQICRLTNQGDKILPQVCRCASQV